MFSPLCLSLSHTLSVSLRLRLQLLPLLLLLLPLLCVSHTHIHSSSSASILNTSASSSSSENSALLQSDSAQSLSLSYHVLIDSGSTGSRVYVYQYLASHDSSASPSDSSTDSSTVIASSSSSFDALSLVEVAHKRVRPALSTFYNDYRGLKKQLKELVSFAESYVTVSKRARTSLSLQATAGLRVLPSHEQEWIISRVKSILSKTSFAVDPEQTRVLTGGEEALFALLATNTAFGNVSLHSAQGFSLGAADLGGSSQQVAFMLPRRNWSWKMLIQPSMWSMWWGSQPYPKQCQPDYRLAINGSNEYLEIFAKSMPGLGLVEAMRDTLYEIGNKYINSSQKSEPACDESCDLSRGTSSPLVVSDDEKLCAKDNMETFVSADNAKDLNACSLNLHESTSSESSNSSAVQPTLLNPCVGIGARYPYPDDLNDLPWVGTGNFDLCVEIVRERLRISATSEMNCLRNIRKPTIVAMDNFPKVLEVLKLANDSVVSPAAIRQAGQRICQQSWTDILAEFPDFFPFRAHQACFGASFIYSIITELYGLDENSTSFFPTDNHHSYTVGWPLGSAIYTVMRWSFEELNTANGVL